MSGKVKGFTLHRQKIYERGDWLWLCGYQAVWNSAQLYGDWAGYKPEADKLEATQISCFFLWLISILRPMWLLILLASYCLTPLLIQSLRRHCCANYHSMSRFTGRQRVNLGLEPNRCEHTERCARWRGERHAGLIYGLYYLSRYCIYPIGFNVKIQKASMHEIYCV